MKKIKRYSAADYVGGNRLERSKETGRLEEGCSPDWEQVEDSYIWRMESEAQKERHASNESYRLRKIGRMYDSLRFCTSTRLKKSTTERLKKMIATLSPEAQQEWKEVV